jgi:hypothetical protein
VLLRSMGALVLACGVIHGAQAQTERFGLDKLRGALDALPKRSTATPPAQEQAPAAAATGSPAPAAPAPTQPSAATASAAPTAAPEFEQWTSQLSPTSAHSPYVVLAGMRFEAFSNPCSDGKGRCWVPIPQIQMAGPVATGEEVHLTYKAGGRPWFTERFRPEAATALLRDRNGGALLYRLRPGRNHEHLARHTGRIEFELTHVAPLRGASRKLASGHFVVGKEQTGLGGADHVDYYVAYDWATEVMTVDFMGSGDAGLDYPGITVRAVFLQPVDRNESMSLHLFHGGKEIASAASWGNDWSTSARNQKTRQGYGALGTAWALPNVVAYASRGQKNPGYFVLGENPGEYTIKILRSGELAREASFTITPQGTIDRSFNIAAHLPHGYTVLRAKVLGQQDRARRSFGADGLWGNAASLK